MHWCGLYMTKSAGMWMWGCWVSWPQGGCKWPRQAVVCGPRVLLKSSRGLIWQDHRCCFLDPRLMHCWWYRSQFPRRENPSSKAEEWFRTFLAWLVRVFLQGRRWEICSIVGWPCVLAVVCKRWQCWKELNCTWPVENLVLESNPEAGWAAESWWCYGKEKGMAKNKSKFCINHS